MYVDPATLFDGNAKSYVMDLLKGSSNSKNLAFLSVLMAVHADGRKYKYPCQGAC